MLENIKALTFDMAARAAGYHSAFVRRPTEWRPSGPPDPVPDPAHDLVIDTFFDLARQPALEHCQASSVERQWHTFQDVHKGHKEDTDANREY
jgi:hypothetical protein